MNKKLIVIIFILLIIITVSFTFIFKQSRLIKSITLEKTRIEQINRKNNFCLYDRGIECSGCDTKNENEICLAKVPEGEIIGRYVHPLKVVK